jgi:hypothetical protein
MNVRGAFGISQFDPFNRPYQHAILEFMPRGTPHVVDKVLTIPYINF